MIKLCNIISAKYRKFEGVFLMIKKSRFIFIICCIMLSSNLYAKEIVLGYVEFPPYEFNKSGKPAGILVEIVQNLFKQSNVPLKLKFYPFKRALEQTKKGDLDGLFNFYKTKERERHFDYTKPVIKNPLVFFAKKGSIVEYKNVKSLKGLKVGVMRGYTYGKKFDQSKIFKKHQSNSHQNSFKMLEKGRIDLYPCDKFVGIHIAKKMKILNKFKILPVPLKVMNGHIGFTKNKHKDVIKKINKSLKMMQKNGEIDKIINQYLKNK